MNSKQKRNWWIDLALFAGFITTFFLDITGVEAHQWIGIFSGALAAYHLFLHRDWVVAVSKRFFVMTSGQARIHYSLDALLLLGFSLIGITGMVISTWINLPLNNFTTWLNIHITISIVTLMTLLLKLALHWRWIERTTRKIWAGSSIAPAKNTVVQPVKVRSSSMGRREFLRVMGVAGAASFLALVNASKSLAETLSTAEEPTTTESIDSQTTSSAATSSNQSSSTSSNSSCVVSCRKACSYPGHCNRYVDTNNNGHCDLGECL